MASIAVRVRMPKRAVRQSECGSGCCDAVPIAGYDGVSAAAKPAGNILTVGVQDGGRSFGHLRKELVDQLVLLGHVRMQGRGPGDDLLAREVVDRSEVGFAPRLLELGNVSAHLLPRAIGSEVTTDDVLEGLPDPSFVGVVLMVVGLAADSAAYAHLMHDLQHRLVGDGDSLLCAQAHGYLAMAASVEGSREDLAHGIPELGAGRSLGMGQRVVVA